MTDLCFAAPVPPGQEERVADWLGATRLYDPERDLVLREAGIRLARGYVETVRDQRVAIIIFDVDEPERAFRLLDRSAEPWTKAFWSFLQHAEPFHPDPVSPLDRLLDDSAPAWGALRDDLGRT